MSVSKADILRALNEPLRQTIEADEWRALTDRYPTTEIFVWHYLRTLYQADALNFDDELTRLGFRLSNRQLFYNFITAHTPRAIEGLSATPQLNDYFQDRPQDNSAEARSLTDLARSLRQARLRTREEERETKISTIENQKLASDQAVELIKEHKYGEALKILKQIDLEKSEKSSYFALQIKYLETITNNIK